MKTIEIPVKNGVLDLDAIPEDVTLKELLIAARQQGITLNVEISPKA